MRYLALAVDYDGTLADEGRVSEESVAALQRLIESGRRLIMVTGRQLDELQHAFDRLDLFEYVVAENGGLLYRPTTNDERLLGEPPPEELVDALRERGVWPLAIGRSVVATREPHEKTVLEVIRDLGIERHIIFNKGAVMVLPSDTNKESGLVAALSEMKLSPHNVVGIGDAENDHAFLNVCELAVAVADALPALKKRADLITEHENGTGVREVIDRLIEDDLVSVDVKQGRYDILLGHDDRGKAISLQPYETSILVAGPSGSGKSTVTTGFLERLAEKSYQFCLIDPEGDYENFAGAVTVGNVDFEPQIDEVLQLLDHPDENVVVNLLGVRLEDRPGFFAGFLPRLQEMRVKTGRPHWIVVDEAHHLLPHDWRPAPETLPRQFSEMLLITVHPSWVSPAILSSVNSIIAVGEAPDKTFAGFAQAINVKAPRLESPSVESGVVYLWQRGKRSRVTRVHVEPGKSERRRHKRKYARGELIPEEHFFFTGPEGRLHLRVQNLITFMQIAEGVDDDTWEWHLRRGDYTNWFRHVIKDNDLADVADHIANDANLSPDDSREAIRREIEHRYTLPAQ